MARASQPPFSTTPTGSRLTAQPATTAATPAWWTASHRHRRSRTTASQRVSTAPATG